MEESLGQEVQTDRQISRPIDTSIDMVAVSRSGGIDGQIDYQTCRYIDRYGCSLSVQKDRSTSRPIDTSIDMAAVFRSVGICRRVDRLADLQIQTGDRNGRILQVRWCRRIDRLADPQILYTYVHICTVHKQIRQHYSIQVMGYRRIDRLVDPQIYICVLQIDTVALPRSDKGYENRGKD